MPVYEYECQECKKVFEVQQKISDKPLSDCPECQAPVKKLMSMSSFQLKGGGWYADGYSSTANGSTKKAEPAKPEPAKPEPAKPATPCQSGAGCKGCPAATAA
ncbi:MAG: zinc ribbon domain-containing protein [Desulforhopalus sp.]|nr:zinc ribbon domain-containing protein [Desulforhopalus sp.]